jgi:hypothetical protein
MLRGSREATQVFDGRFSGWLEPDPIERATTEGGRMPKAILFALLALAGAAFGGGPPVTDLSTATPKAIGHTDVFGCRSELMVAPGAIPNHQCARAVCGNPLLRVGDCDVGHTTYAADLSGGTAGVPRMPGWKQASAYTLEFAAAGVGTLLAEASGLTAIEGVNQAGWNGRGSLAGAAAFCLTSAVLSAGGTHLVGRLFGRGTTFNRALAGGAIGGILGGVAFVDYFVSRKNPHTLMLPIGLVLPPLCTVIAYNVGRSDGRR